MQRPDDSLDDLLRSLAVYFRRIDQVSERAGGEDQDPHRPGQALGVPEAVLLADHDSDVSAVVDAAAVSEAAVVVVPHLAVESAVGLAGSLRRRGYLHVGVVRSDHGRTTVALEDAALAPGPAGTFAFVHAHAAGRFAAALGSLAADTAAVMFELAKWAAAADDRLGAAEEAHAELRQLRRERDELALAARERLEALDALEGERAMLARAADERLAVIDQLTLECEARGREIDALRAAAEERQ